MSTSHTIDIKTLDGKTLQFECDEGSSLVDDAAEAGLRLPAVCREGNCGTCRGHCRKGDGEYRLGSHTADALSVEDLADGDLLLCRTFPRGPMVVSIPVDSTQLTGPPPVESWCQVSSLQKLGGQVFRLVLQVQPDAEGTVNSAFEPGQYMSLQVPQTECWRAYSIANTPNWSGELEFLIRVQPGGNFSTWLATTAKVGDRLRSRGPQGGFCLREGSLAPRRFVAGGTGLAPMLSMLGQMGELQEPHEASLYFGVTRAEQLFGNDAVERLKTLLPKLKVEVCLWEPTPDWAGFVGSPADAFALDLKEDMSKGVPPNVYVCGPPGLVDAVRHAAKNQRLPDSYVMSERFLPT